MEKTLYDFSATSIDGKIIPLSNYKNQVLLIVNTASQCGFTPQYKGLQALYERYNAKGFTVLGFPCNQFAHQEPETEENIQHFCETHFGVTFPLFSKIDVNGENTHPLYQYLKTQATGVLGSEAIKWNFTKFLIDKTGKVVARFASATSPNKISKEIEALLS
jgi:glutathione peroxidase